MLLPKFAWKLQFCPQYEYRLTPAGWYTLKIAAPNRDLWKVGTSWFLRRRVLGGSSEEIKRPTGERSAGVWKDLSSRIKANSSQVRVTQPSSDENLFIYPCWVEISLCNESLQIHNQQRVQSCLQLNGGCSGLGYLAFPLCCCGTLTSLSLLNFSLFGRKPENARAAQLREVGGKLRRSTAKFTPKSLWNSIVQGNLSEWRVSKRRDATG